MSIQKCKPSFEAGATNIQRAPFTQLYNKVIQNCTNMEAGWVWAYLQSQCDDWELNPHQLRKHFGVCKDTMYKILNYMISANLLVRHVQTTAKGTHLSTTYTVLDGTEYIDPSRVVEKSAHQNAPDPEKQDPVLQDPVKQDIKKERGLEKKESNKEISNNYSATDVAQARANDDAFENYWKINPVKKNRIRAKKIWDKKKLYKIETIICADILDRLENDSQWQDKQYIPHPSTYLFNELWNDEITQPSTPKKSSGKSSSFDEYQAELKKQTRGTTYEHSAIPQ